MKKGQVMGLPLVLIFGLIVAALILFFGVRWIISLQNQADYVDLLDSIRDLDTYVQTFENFDEGSSKIYSLDFPSDIDSVCFYDQGTSFNCQLNGGPCSVDLDDYIQLVGDANSNVYIYSSGNYDRTRFAISSFQPKGANPVCVSNKGTVLITSEKDTVGIAYYGQ